MPYHKYTKLHRQAQYLPAHTVSFMVVQVCRAWKFRKDCSLKRLQSFLLSLFLKYPEFALNYSSRLESALITSNTISSDDAEENFKQLYEKMRHSIYEKFQYDIGA